VRIDLEALANAANADRGELDALMAAYAPRQRAQAWRPGQRISGRVSRVSASTVFLDIGGKADAAIDRMELGDDVAVGQTLECFVLQTQDGELRLTRSLGGDSTREMLEEARENGIPVEGKVTGRNDHGFEVALSGGVRAFCPLSQIDHSPEPDLDTYLGRTLAFRILDVRGREAVVSHRAIAAEEAKTEQGKRLGELREGEVYDGVVTGLRDFGAFVRLANGAEGLVRIPNIGKARIGHPKEVLAEGQAVVVKVLGIEPARQRVDLGIRQAQDSAPHQPSPPKAELSAGTSGFGTLAGLLGGVVVPQRKKLR
jgi:small subunit ribosomal protein S1